MKTKPIAYGAYDNNGRKVLIKRYAPHDARVMPPAWIKKHGLSGRVSSCTIVAKAFQPVK